jgi:cobalt-zinc-cadmium efflux system membrane fusion protein
MSVPSHNRKIHSVDAASFESIQALPLRSWKWRLIIAAGMAVLLVVGAVIVASIRGKAATPASAAPVRDAPVLDGEIIRFSEGFAKRAGLNTAAVELRPLQPFVNVNGSLQYDPHRFGAVGARIPGRARRVFKVAGDYVKAGQPLVEIESAELGHAEAQVFAARARALAAETDMKRERRLADAKVSSEREAETAKANYEVARAEKMAAERAVAALGGDMDSAVGVMTLRSPIDGKVVSANVVRGQTVQASDTLFEIADTSSLWAMLTVFERDVALVHEGDEVEIVPPGEGAPVIKGRVDHVGGAIDVQTRSTSVRVVVPNPDATLRPGQSVAARLHVRAAEAKTLVVPQSAITRIDGKPSVFVSLGRTEVKPRLVELGAQDASLVAVREGLREGERIVVEGVFALKSELFR